MTRGIVGLALGLGLVGVTQKASADTVKVASGDTISQIAQEHNDTVEHIQKVNHLKDVDLIFPGDKIVTGKTNPDKRDIQVQQQPQVVAQAPVQQNKQSQVQTPAPAPKVAQTANNGVSQGSTKEQFLQAGGTEAMWNNIVIPESNGEANVTSSNGYHGLGQTKESWGTGSVSQQTQGMIRYANERYGSVSNAIAYHQNNNAW